MDANHELWGAAPEYLRPRLGRLGFVQWVGAVTPKRLMLLYPGKVVFNTMGLDEISLEDLAPIVDAFQ
jgi:hypothetical protein